jgi:hypothetical protein
MTSVVGLSMIKNSLDYLTVRLVYLTSYNGHTSNFRLVGIRTNISFLMAVIKPFPSKIMPKLSHLFCFRNYDETGCINIFRISKPLGIDISGYCH